MHELSLAENVLEIAERRRLQAHANKIAAIELEIGQLSAVEPEALRFAMDALMPDSTAASAQIEYRLVPGSALCRQCATRFALEFLYDACPTCASFDKQILAGDELLIKSVSFA
jgi:hydrogenase nickel incorporation protein HypA/HybF